MSDELQLNDPQTLYRRWEDSQWPGLVGAYGTEEEATFLATQQVDEARHMQFYARFQDEVVAAPSEIASHIERARASISVAFDTSSTTSSSATTSSSSGPRTISRRRSASSRSITRSSKVTQDDIRAFALGGLTRRLSIIGVPLETVYAS